ncbi:hypothetical protein FQZ97_838160 [compost metagenome]
MWLHPMPRPLSAANSAAKAVATAVAVVVAMATKAARRVKVAKPAATRGVAKAATWKAAKAVRAVKAPVATKDGWTVAARHVANRVVNRAMAVVVTTAVMRPRWTRPRAQKCC